MHKSSPKIHPTDHTSMAALYFFSNKINSGALYHLVATWIDKFEGFIYFVFVYLLIPNAVSSVFILLYSFCNSSRITVLARPKSHNLTDFSYTSVRIFYGFKSRWRTWHSWQYFKPNKIWKTTLLISSSESNLFEKNIFLISFYKYYKTKYNVTLSFYSTMISLSWIMFGCLRFLSKMISLNTRVDSWILARNDLIFLIATISLVLIFLAFITTDDTPCPSCWRTSYLPAIV